jgi:glycosyltransferase involved in cell wall biosynthesis
VSARPVIERWKRRVRHTGAFVAARDIRSALRRLVREAPLHRVVSLKPDGTARGTVLLSSSIEPFILAAGRPPRAHPRYWEARQMAQTFLDLGYAVDVVSDKNDRFVPTADYAICIDVRWNLERFRTALGDRALHVMHADTAHMLFQNAAEARRLLELQQRRGVVMRPRRFERPTLAIEHAHCAVIHGNDFTLGTYRYADKPMYAVPTPALTLFPFPDGKDIDRCRKRFVWLASNGMVHKGLDLALDAFAGLPDHHLVVCGPVQRERDFETFYWKQLYESPNVTTLGWTDVTSPQFAEIVNSSVALVYPSCSEGQAGAVTTCLQGGLIPIASYQSGVDVDDFGLVLQQCTVEEIRDAVRRVSSLPGNTLREMSQKAWTTARARYTPEAFARRYRDVAVELLSRSEGAIHR